MKIKTKIVFVIILIAILLIPILTRVATAYADGVYEIDWWTVDGGGGVSQGGEYTLQGTLGQPDAVSSQGGDYGLAGGFWAGMVDWVRQFLVHLPVVFR